MTRSNPILATRARSLPAELMSSGFHRLEDAVVAPMLTRAGLWLGPRSELELDETFRQLIPYIVLVGQGGVVSYRRTATGGENRLHGLLSIGLGGHIDLADLVTDGDQIDLARTLETAARREVEEEVGAVDVRARHWVGVLVDNDTAVGRVHLGVVAVWTITDHRVEAAEHCLRDVEYKTIDSVQRAREDLESWSAMLVPSLARWLP